MDFSPSIVFFMDNSSRRLLSRRFFIRSNGDFCWAGSIAERNTWNLPFPDYLSISA
jgi:hypothetical protein